ncbi:MAG: hypothetical protein D6B25_04370 [Desulfobulbaceae bacterium]|nr:MAG: hypothetical protein D6B25_04370 [Desulfobulbaceae bacterium]
MIPDEIEQVIENQQGNDVGYHTGNKRRWSGTAHTEQVIENQADTTISCNFKEDTDELFHTSS